LILGLKSCYIHLYSKLKIEITFFSIGYGLLQDSFAQSQEMTYKTILLQCTFLAPKPHVTLTDVSAAKLSGRFFLAFCYFRMIMHRV